MKSKKTKMQTPTVGRRGGGGQSSERSAEEPQTWSKRAHAWFLKAQRRIPLLKKGAEMVYRVPPRARVAFIIFWFGWKIVAAIVIIFFLHNRADEGSAMSANNGILPMHMVAPTRVLYVITTLAEYNNGKRSTKSGQDRFAEVLLPILIDNVQSMTSPPFNYDVDVFLITAYELKRERENMIRDRLPHGVGLEIWDDACPSGYEKRHSPNVVIDNTRALARQHRYVVRDKLQYYDVFAAFEDDMRVTGHHVEHFLDMSDELEQLRLEAPISLSDIPENFEDPSKMKFFGQMTRDQMDRLVPGFIRVEVLRNETANGAQKKLDPVPIDFTFDDIPGQDTDEAHVDPTVCCHVNMEPNIETPKKPKSADLVIWETNITAFSLRQLPPASQRRKSKFDWTVVMLGPGKNIDRSKMVGGYWSGREGAFGKLEKPSGGPPNLIAQQGGWMATREQITRLNGGLCMGSFLPPFNHPIYNEDGQQSMNVEFWSGSYQFFTGVRGGCNMQRLISMHPDHFSKHLMYHVANNKQKQLGSFRMLRADHLFGQLNTVRKQAVQAKEVVQSISTKL